MDLRVHNLPSNTVNAPTSKKVAENFTALDFSDRFSKVLNEAIDNLNAQQKEVHQLNEQFIRGELSDPHELMIASQKALLGLELTVQLRNKVVEAYQEVMRMQI